LLGQAAVERVVARTPEKKDLLDLMSGVQPVANLIRPAEHDNSKEFATMVVPDQIAAGFLYPTVLRQFS